MTFNSFSISYFVSTVRSYHERTTFTLKSWFRRVSWFVHFASIVVNGCQVESLSCLKEVRNQKRSFCLGLLNSVQIWMELVTWWNFLVSIVWGSSTSWISSRSSLYLYLSVSSSKCLTANRSSSYNQPWNLMFWSLCRLRLWMHVACSEVFVLRKLSYSRSSVCSR